MKAKVLKNFKSLSGTNDIAAWNGGGYAVSANSAVKEEAIQFLNYMYQPDKLSKYGWENGAGMSPQNQVVSEKKPEMIRQEKADMFGLILFR